MSVFICWSGDRSYELANAVAVVLTGSIRGLKESDVFVSDRIEKGLNWFDTILAKLEDATVGIVCLTAENVAGAWLHFEAGALANRLAHESPPGPAAGSSGPEQPRHTLFPLLHRITGADLRGPLGAYQGTSTTQSDMNQMVRAVAVSLGLRLKDPEQPIPDDVWSDFEAVADNLAVPVRSLVPHFASLFQLPTFTEPLQKCTDQAWVRRYDGARITHEVLRQERERVERSCAPHEREIFKLLLNELDGYAMSIQTLLITSPPMKLTKQGELGVNPPVLRCCEDRRLAVKSLVGRLLEPDDEPVLEDAAAFVGADTPEERKLIVHRLEERIRQHRESAYDPPPGLRKRRVRPAVAIERITEGRSPVSLRASSWDLDRIYYYLLIQYFETLALRWEPRQKNPPQSSRARPVREEYLCAVRDVEMEVERFRAKAKGASIMPLTYSLAALAALEPRRSSEKSVSNAMRSVVTLVKEQLQEVSRVEAVPIRRLLASFEVLPPSAAKSTRVVSEPPRAPLHPSRRRRRTSATVRRGSRRAPA